MLEEDLIKHCQSVIRGYTGRNEQDLRERCQLILAIIEERDNLAIKLKKSNKKVGMLIKCLKKYLKGG